jgi:hypothetical protein
MREAHSREIPSSRAAAAMLPPAATEAAMWMRRAVCVDLVCWAMPFNRARRLNPASCWSEDAHYRSSWTDSHSRTHGRARASAYWRLLHANGYTATGH